MNASASRPRLARGRQLRRANYALAAWLVVAMNVARADPYLPESDTVILAELPAGAHYADLSARRLARGRVDVAVPLAQFYIQQSRLTGDLRFLGYADAVLAPWLDHRQAAVETLVLHATVQQSRHEFAPALATLELALAVRPDDPQASLTKATILRVLGRYPEATLACDRFARSVDPPLAALCSQSVLGLDGHLEAAYAALLQISTQGWLNTEKSWLYSELGEMAARLGADDDARRWFQRDLDLMPTDVYVRTAFADLLLRQGHDVEALELLRGTESFEPLLLRIAIAQQRLHDPALPQSSARLRAAFSAELQRGEAVHRREQARFLLEVEHQPLPALEAAQENWKVQREPEDILVLVAAARAAGKPAAAEPALDFVRRTGLTDARLNIAAPMAMR
jgi:tetratricopeptide (TPR) repeat protein